MGRSWVWDFISSTNDSIKRNTPDLSSVKGLYWSSYDYSRAAVTKIPNIVAKSAAVDQLYQHLPDEKALYKITANLAKNCVAFGFQEGLKCLPYGSTVYKIVHRSICNDNKSSGRKEDLRELKDKVARMEKELSDYRKLLEQTEINKSITEPKYLNQKPEDVIRIFMMTEFVGNHLLHDLIVPGVRSGKHPK